MTLLAKLRRLTVRQKHANPASKSHMLIPTRVNNIGVLEKAKRRLLPRKKPAAWSPPITLQSLPPELLTLIASLLAPIDRASLAFTSYWLHNLFKNATTLNGFDKWFFLCRLEQSHMWPDEILCDVCRKFHEPRKSRTFFTEKEGRRACVLNGAAHVQRSSVSPYLSRGVHFDVMSAISRSNRFIFGVLPPGQRSVKFVQPLFNDEGKLIIRLQQKMYISSQKHILIKSQRILFPGKNTGRQPNKIIEGVEALHRTLQESEELGSICGHAKWTDMYPFITQPDEEFKWPVGQWSFRYSKMQEFDLPGQQLQECLWTHKGDCWLNCHARARLDSALEGRVWSCGGCTTDYAVNVIRSESSSANYIVMTSWKDLGTCSRRNDPLWKEHMNYGVHAGHKRTMIGTIAGQIETLVRAPDGFAHYFPKISKTRLREIFIDEGGDKGPTLNGNVEVDS
ncbi:hypothetical protein FNAPI_5281 [Fusarium napiforme]|uniref:F-box domain-containing protein n=1 Tax=Fusarium napiforme TaxID=42672 RepID=A0A8H5JM96_9HYPO|nr:hypothetical protein FNAPI_5281 [Fusarium napiforme]